MTKPKLNPIAVTMRNGQMFHHSARNGAPKRLTDPQPTHGAKRQTTGSLHPYLHGVALQDEPNSPDKLHTGKQVPVHLGMQTNSPAHRAKEADGFAMLREASRLGCPKG